MSTPYKTLHQINRLIFHSHKWGWNPQTPPLAIKRNWLREQSLGLHCGQGVWLVWSTAIPCDTSSQNNSFFLLRLHSIMAPVPENQGNILSNAICRLFFHCSSDSTWDENYELLLLLLTSWKTFSISVGSHSWNRDPLVQSQFNNCAIDCLVSLTKENFYFINSLLLLYQQYFFINMKKDTKKWWV